MRKLFQIAVLGAATLAVSGSALAQEFTVETNKTKQLKLRGIAASVVIGDPIVADIAVLDQNLIFVTGRTFGTTNILVFDENGRELYSGDVVVTTNTSNFVSLNRAGQTNTFDCAPRCQSIPNIGDEQEYFQNINLQTRNQQLVGQEGN